MKFSKDILFSGVLALITTAIFALGSCGKSDEDSDESSNEAAVNSLTIELNASCDGEPCL